MVRPSTEGVKPETLRTGLRTAMKEPGGAGRKAGAEGRKTYLTRQAKR